MALLILDVVEAEAWDCLFFVLFFCFGAWMPKKI